MRRLPLLGLVLAGLAFTPPARAQAPSAAEPAFWMPALAGPATPPPQKDHGILKTPVVTCVLQHQKADRWFGYDKVQHVTFSFLFTLGAQYSLVNKLDVGERSALPVSAGVSAAIGISKELHDRYVGPTRYLSPKDLVADGVGILLAAGWILL